MSEIADFYSTHQTDNTVTDHDRLAKVSRAVIAARPHRLLDIGCGRGHLLNIIRSSLVDCELYGLEISPRSAAEARSFGITVFERDVKSGIPLDDGFIDTVVLGEVIEHLVDPDQCLDEIGRVLAPGGTLVLTTPNLACWANRVLLLAGVQPLFTETSTRRKYGRALEILGNKRRQSEGHLRIYTHRALVEMIRDYGFVVDKTVGATFPGFLLFPGIAQVEQFFSRLPSMASTLIVIATKSGKPLA